VTYIPRPAMLGWQCDDKAQDESRVRIALNGTADDGWLTAGSLLVFPSPESPLWITAPSCAPCRKETVRNPKPLAADPSTCACPRACTTGGCALH
jgi:hypothetical protein